MSRTSLLLTIGMALVGVLLAAAEFVTERQDPSPLRIDDGSSIVLVGNNLCSRMMSYGHFETEVFLRYPNAHLTIRNMCDPGNTPGFRPHAGRTSPWAFPGAEAFYADLARESGSEGNFDTPDGWLAQLEADVIVAFFGYNESFRGADEPETFRDGLSAYHDELDAFVTHTLNQRYNGDGPPRLALVSPIAFENLSGRYDLPDGERENARLARYTEVMRQVAERHGVPFVDAFSSTRSWYAAAEEPLTVDGFQMGEAGYARLAALIADRVFGGSASEGEVHRSAVRDAVLEKNWYWQKDFKMPNGVHAFGRRFLPFGPDNYPAERRKLREMIAIRDTAIWLASSGEQMDLAAADARTTPLPPVETNFRPLGDDEEPPYRYGREALAPIQPAPGYRVELFASERDFPDLANPVQIAFDNAGRLWVATMPTYPHWKPGDPRPNDKLIILEDTDADGRADRQTTFADDLHLPVGFELAPEGVYVSQPPDLVLLRDVDGDDRADVREIVLSGFDDHDTHHAISAFTADPSGAIYMGEGVFLHSNVETAYGPVRATNGGFYRYDPRRRHLERTAQLAIPNPWGIAFDAWGQLFFAETSSPDVRWMTPGTIRPRYGVSTHKSFNLIEEAHQVRPTSGLEFVSSRHFPDEVQGDLLINNTIGFLGTKQHAVEDDGTGYAMHHRLDLVQSTDRNFRPVDMEFAPDGSLYVADWHNVLIGHMQHNARDPLRDHVHGRIYRITYPSRPLVEPADVAGADIEVLLDNLKLPEYRTRYRSRRELRGRDADAVLASLEPWIDSLDRGSSRFEHHLLEALWVTWGMNRIDASLLQRLLHAENFRVRAAAVRVLRYGGHQIEDQVELLLQAARDEHGRVRLEAVAAASWLEPAEGLRILAEASERSVDRWMEHAYATARAHLHGREVAVEQEEAARLKLNDEERALFNAGKQIYSRDGFCGTCHQVSGEGLSASGYPPLAGTGWVLGSEERLIKLTLKGLYGPIEVLGKRYGGEVPMTPFAGLLDDEEVAAVLTYVRNAFGNEAPAISPTKVKEVREAIEDRSGFYTADELLEEHPIADDE